jgi:hypothetical protein
MTVKRQIADSVSRVLAPVGFNVVLLAIFEIAFEVVIEDDSLVVACDEIPLCE